jgi:hypothetical protein
MVVWFHILLPHRLEPTAAGRRPPERRRVRPFGHTSTATSDGFERERRDGDQLSRRKPQV